MRSKTIVKLSSAALVATSLIVLPVAASADVNGGVITSAGPLTSITTTPDLNCAVNHSGDDSGEFYGDTSCGTLVAVGGTLYGPAQIPAGPRPTPWTPQSQTSSGSGTAADPYRVVTVVKGGPLVVTQTDTYVVGSEAYGTRVQVQNTADAAEEVTVYRAADCYLQNSDQGYGRSDSTAGSVSCVTSTDPGARIEQWAPLTPGSHFFESYYGTVWDKIVSQQPFPDTSDDSTYQDNGAGLSWTATIPAGATSSFSHLTAFSPNGTTNVSDSDGDGFPDAWETPDGGVDTNGDGKPDLKLSDYGATPNKPDIFVQVNWLENRGCSVIRWICSTTTRRPSLAALRDVQAVFAQHGIRLHIDAGPDSLMNPDTGATWGSLSAVGGNPGGPSKLPGVDESSGTMNWSQFDVLRNRMVSAQRQRIFHEALYVGSFDDAQRVGLARGNGAGRDFVIARDVLGSGEPTRTQEAAAFLHELGNNLGLGGDDNLGVVDNATGWPGILYDGGGTLGGAGDPASAPGTTGDTEPTAQQLLASATDPKAVGVTVPGQLGMKTGTSAPLQITITNHRDAQVTYDLTQIARGVTVTGLPARLTLAAGESRNLTITVTAGGVGNFSYIEVDAADPGDSTNVGSAASAVFVVADAVPDEPGTPGSVVQSTGDGQSAAPGKALAAPLTATVTDAYGTPVAGATVTFTATAGAKFANGTATTTAKTGANGVATSSAVTAGGTAGPFNVTAVAPGTTSAVYTETAASTAKDRADLRTTLAAPATVTPGTTYTATVTVKNAGSATAKKALASVAVPYGVQVTGAGGATTSTTGALLFHPGDLASGKTVTYKITFKVTDTARFRTSLLLPAVALSAIQDPALTNNATRPTITIKH